MKIFLHTKGADVSLNNQYLDIDTIPHIGEYISLSTSGPWFVVRVVTYTPHEDSHVSAEVYATQADPLESLHGWQTE